LREQIKALSKQSHYEAYKESFAAQSPLEVPQEVVEDFTEKFTVRNFKEDIASVFPVLYRLMKENEIGYNDIVDMTSEQEDTSEDLEIIENQDEFDRFESWVMGLGEESAIQSQDPDEQQAVIQKLQQLVGQAFPAGVDGSNAIESLKGIIDDPQLQQQIKAQSKEDENVDVRGLIQGWLELYAPEALEQLDFGDFDPNAQGAEQEAPAEEPAAQEAPAEEPVTQSDDNEEGREGHSSMNVQELAEFIHSFYDKESGTFPKGPEGVALMVGKKFGERAEHVARKMVERMAPQQSTNQNPELAELARIKELSGM
jgi:hypothetical protein